MRYASADHQATDHKQNPSVTIVISTYNRADSLARTLECLGYLRYDNFDIIVVNGPSTDHTAEILAAHSERIIVVACQDRNLSKSRNLGISRSEGSIVAFIDDDALPEPDWLDELVSAFEDPRVGGVGGFIRDHTGVTFQAKYVVSDLWGRSEGFETYEQASDHGRDQEPTFLSLTGTNSALRKEALATVGLFDENFEYFLDETDVNLRLVNAGFELKVVESAEIHHKYAPSHLRDHKNVPKNMEPICRSIAYFALKHALNTYGWVAVRDRLSKLERDEINWKLENLRYGDIDKEHFKTLTHQIRSGIRQGITRGADLKPEPTLELTPSDHVSKPSSPPVIKKAADRLRLCMLSQDECSPTPGGIGYWTRIVASGLARLGHEITIIGRSATDRNTVDFDKERYWRHLISPQSNFFSDQYDALGLPQALASYTRSIRAEIERTDPRRRFDAVSGPIWDVELASMINSKFATCLSLHTTAALALESKPEWTQNKEYYRNHVSKVIAAEKSCLKRAKYVLANSDAIVSDCERLYRIERDHRFVVIPHGIPDVPADVRYSAMNKTRSTINLLFVGRLETRKGLNTLVPALDTLLSKFNHVRVDLVGSGVEEKIIKNVQDLQQKFLGRVIHHGYVADERLAHFYENADVFIGPSKYESFGLIFVEAMRYGIPCVATLAGGIPEVVKQGETGLLSPIDDEAALYSNLSDIVTNDELRKYLGSSGRRRYEQMFTSDLMVRRLEQFYLNARQGGQR